MYSMVLMAALTAATDMPDFGRRGGCCGCYGGYGRGGWGGCYGGYGWGGWGGGYGGYGWGGWGGGYGVWGGGYGGWGGGYGGWGGYVYAPVVSTYAAPMMLAANPIPATTIPTRSMYYSPTTSANNRATITVHLPDDATLLVDGNQTTSVSNTRQFYTPPLEPNKSYHYNFEAMVKRDGQPVKVTKGVDVVAGERRVVNLTIPNLNQTSERQPPTQPAERNAVPERRNSP